MRVLVCPDKYAGTLTAREAALAIAAGWSSVAPEAVLDLAPLSDGGPGFVEVLHDALGGSLVALSVADPLLRPVVATFLVHEGAAYVESAQACGLHLLAPAERDPERASTYGVGELLRAAVEAGVDRVVVGLGGSATTDGGEGALAALGGGWPAGVGLVAATDVTAPLLGPSGAAAVFGPQKGAGPPAVARLERRLEEQVRRLGRADLAGTPGAGAAGGLGFALLTLGATVRGGVDLVAEAVRLGERAAAADLVVTGEGRLDGTSLRGKVLAGAAGAALAAGVPCIAVCGQVEVGRRRLAAAGVSAAYSAAELAGSAGAALAEPARWVSASAAGAARSWT